MRFGAQLHLLKENLDCVTKHVILQQTLTDFRTTIFYTVQTQLVLYIITILADKCIGFRIH